MSILFINSSPNPTGNTARVAAALLEGKEYETLNLAEYKIYGYWKRTDPKRDKVRGNRKNQSTDG